MKIKNIKIYITEIGLIASALCTGCSLNSNETKDNYTNTNTSSSITNTTEDNNNYSSSSVIESDNTDNTINVEKINETERSFIQKKSVINTSFSKTMDVINNTKINCNYSDLFEIDKALQFLKDKKIPKTNNLVELLFKVTFPGKIKRIYRTYAGAITQIKLDDLKWIERNVLQKAGEN